MRLGDRASCRNVRHGNRELQSRVLTPREWILDRDRRGGSVGNGDNHDPEPVSLEENVIRLRRDHLQVRDGGIVGCDPLVLAGVDDCPSTERASHEAR